MNTPVHVFATSVETPGQVKTLAKELNSIVGKGNWNFALDDCDRILRVLSQPKNALAASRALRAHGFSCAELE